MAKNTKILSRKFLVGLGIYAVAFLVVAAAGLGVLWKFLVSYELSRPKNTLNAYIMQMTPEQMCEGSDELFASLDQNLQSREEFDRVIRESVMENLSYAKVTSESTEEHQVYVLRSGKTPIGRFSIGPGPEVGFGFKSWQVTESSFDFSHLMGQSVSVTVPSDYQVRFRNTVLDERYITETGIHYGALEEFYDNYQLPYLVTYTADNFLGEGDLEVLDRNGNFTVIIPGMDMDVLLPQCTDEEFAAVEAFSEKFADLWIQFSSSTEKTVGTNFFYLRQNLSADGVLDARLRSAVYGLTYGQSGVTRLQDVVVNRVVPLGDGTYMSDMTYYVKTWGKYGPVELDSNMKLIIVTEKDKLKVQAMARY